MKIQKLGYDGKFGGKTIARTIVASAGTPMNTLYIIMYTLRADTYTGYPVPIMRAVYYERVNGRGDGNRFRTRCGW